MTRLSLEEWLQAARALQSRTEPLELVPMHPLPTDWSPETLNRCEAALLDMYAGPEAVPADVAQEIQLYLGNGLVEQFNGRWVDLADFGFDETGFGVAYSNLEHVEAGPGMASVPFFLKSGTHWASLFATNQMLLTNK